ncbi:glycosyltransferase, partial [Pseudomonas sp. F1_0610]|uniref:glycosyltransferase n=1 Tax=Pseudomonas sp. F1_0610 TaxID=3114284 RepID=UPI0039C11C69
IKLLVAVGRLEQQKDYFNLIKAFQYIRENDDNIRLWIVGEGSQRNVLEKIIKEKKLEDHVKLLGMQEDIVGILSAADLFVLSSAYEGFGLVVAEAMLTEKIVVATDCGGVSEVVGEFGFLCPPQDPILLSKSINAALNLTEDERKKLATNAREHVISNFSLEMITKQWLEIYENLIRDKNFYRNKKN